MEYKDEKSFMKANSRKFHNAINSGCGTHKANVKNVKNHRYNFKDPNLYYALRSYSGEGFFVANKELCKTQQITWGYDIHWAYGGALIHNEFPLSLKVSETPSKLGVVQIKINLKNKKDLLQYKRYPQFDYTLFYNNQFYSEIKDADCIYAWFTTLDYEIFKDMYNIEHTILQQLYYQDIGPLPQEVHELVKQAYIDKKKPENSQFKSLYEAVYYGLSAKDLKKDIHKKYNDNTLRFYDFITVDDIMDAAGILHLDGEQENKQQIRPEYCIIATWQTAYTRYREWKHFKENINSVIYMNTDSIYSTKPIDLGEDKGLGYYALEYNGLPVLYLRRGAYIIFNEDGSYKKTITGIIDNYFTEEQIELLKAGQYVDNVHSRDKDGNEVLVTLDPEYINGGAFKQFLKRRRKNR